MAPRILIADDEQMIRKLFGMIITSEFPEALIDQAMDGKEAVEAFAEGCHDLVIMDLQMPDQDGRESFFEILKVCQKNQWAIPPIIFCTGFTPSESLAEIIKDSSIHCLLRKPVKAESLLEAVRIRLQK
jgi:CheY-like chemotaxis protein